MVRECKANYKPGKRYPLMIQTHGFEKDQFSLFGIARKPNVLDFWNRRLNFFAEHLDMAIDARGTVVFERGRAKPRAAAH